MEGKTHLAVGAASAVLITHPTTVQEFAVATFVGGVAGLLSDLDSKNSKGSHLYEEVIRLLKGSIALFLVFGLGYRCYDVILLAVKQKISLTSAIPIIAQRFWSSSIVFGWLRGSWTAVVGAIIILVNCKICTTRPHREYAHGIPCLLVFELGLLLMAPVTLIAFMIGFLSHLVIDFPNKRKVKLFAPFSKIGVSFGVASSSGKASKALRVVAQLAVVGGFFLMKTEGGLAGYLTSIIR